MFVHDYIRSHLLANAGVCKTKRIPDLESLKDTERNEEFRRLCDNRFIMGAFRYGLMSEPGKKRFDRVQSAIDRLKKYQEDGNSEHLVDAANLCELEFDDPNHKDFHFNSVDDTDLHTKEIK